MERHATAGKRVNVKSVSRVRISVAPQKMDGVLFLRTTEMRTRRVRYRLCACAARISVAPQDYTSGYCYVT